MTTYAGRDLLLKVSNDGAPPLFLTLGAARTTIFDATNELAEATLLGGGQAATYSGEAGSGNIRITLQGIFKDSTAEAKLRQLALSATQCRYRLVFPNGQTYEADFIVESYRREGSHDGLEMFSVGLIRSGEGAWTIT